MYVWGFAYIYIRVHIHRCQEGVNCLVLSYSSYSLKTGSLTEPGGRQWPMSPRDPLVFGLNSAGL